MTSKSKDRVSMFNLAQQKDLAEKERAIEAQKSDDGDSKPIKSMSIRMPKELWTKMMLYRIESGKSLNEQIVEAVEEKVAKLDL